MAAPKIARHAANPFRKRDEELAGRNVKQIELGREGADGTIDGLALHAILRSPAPGSIIRQLSSVTSMELSDGSSLVWDEGHVYSFDDGTGRVGWMRDLVTIKKFRLPSTLAIAAEGRPITEIFEHPALSDTMPVKHVFDETDQGSSETHIRLDLPRYYFDTATGRWWPCLNVD